LRFSVEINDRLVVVRERALYREMDSSGFVSWACHVARDYGRGADRARGVLLVAEKREVSNSGRNLT
jgi:hypothetical protein